MAAKVALAVLISVGLLVVSVATASAVLIEPSITHAVAAGGAAQPVDVLLDCAESSNRAASRGHHGWNTASWLIGLSLVLAISRRTQPQLAA